MFGFGSQRKKATKLAIEAVRPTIGIVQNTYGIPPGFWRDPYILGFLFVLVRSFVKAAPGQKISDVELGGAVIDVLTALSNMNGEAISRVMVALFDGGDPEFKRGMEDARAVFLYTFKQHRNEAGDTLVLAATSLVDGGLTDGGDRRSNIASAMVQLSYMREVRERLVG